MYIRVPLLIIVCLCLLPASTAAAQRSVPLPAIVVLKVEGKIEYEREGWINYQPLLPGAIISPADLIYPHRATLLVMCPDGSTHEFLQSELLPNAAVNCPTKPAAYIVGDSGTKRLNTRRGGRQDPSIPYLIAPRATVVRTPQVELRWNPVQNVQANTVTVRGGEQPWQSGDLTPSSVVRGGVARLKLPVKLHENTPYTVQICVLYRDMNRHCTTDPDWSTDDNLAFYYLPTPELNKAEQQVIDGLGADTPESLYARAVLLSQPVYSLSQADSIGLYDEAIVLLERIKAEYSKSELASSPGLYNLLGELYRDISLPVSAAQNFAIAAQLAEPGTEAAAGAALGRAMTQADGDAVVSFYNEALDHYARFLNPETFQKRLAAVCQQIGDLRFDVDRCR
jgi:hypothetical protein